MTQKDKQIARFLTLPSDFHYDELVTLLGYYGFKETKTGKTSGSRVKFINQKGIVIIIHKPHPSGILKHYQLKQVKEILGL
jgi:hypothetical protein